MDASFATFGNDVQHFIASRRVGPPRDHRIHPFRGHSRGV